MEDGQVWYEIIPSAEPLTDKIPYQVQFQFTGGIDVAIDAGSPKEALVKAEAKLPDLLYTLQVHGIRQISMAPHRIVVDQDGNTVLTAD